MKKLIIPFIILMLCSLMYSNAGIPVQQKVFQIHTEKRAFVKKGDRKHRRHHHHPKKNRMGDKKHFMENHKK